MPNLATYIFLLSVLTCLICSLVVFVRMYQRDDRRLIAKAFLFFLACPVAFWLVALMVGVLGRDVTVGLAVALCTWATVASVAIAFLLLYLRGWMDRLGKVMWIWTACIGVAAVSGLLLSSA